MPSLSRLKHVLEPEQEEAPINGAGDVASVPKPFKKKKNGSKVDENHIQFLHDRILSLESTVNDLSERLEFSGIEKTVEDVESALIEAKGIAQQAALTATSGEGQGGGIAPRILNDIIDQRISMISVGDSSFDLGEVENIRQLLDRDSLFDMNNIYTTTNTSEKNVLIGTTKELSAGHYNLDISYMWNTDSVSKEIVTSITVDGRNLTFDNTPILHVDRPNTSVNLGAEVEGTGSGLRQSFYTTLPLHFLEDDTHDLRLTFNARIAGAKVSLWHPHLFIYKIDD